MRRTALTAILVAITATLAAVPGAVTAAVTVTAAMPTNVDVSQRLGNESEEAIAVNPTNPNNIVVFTNVGHAESGLTAGMFLAVSFDGGITWTKRLVGLGPGDTLGDSCCDPSLSFDQYGNLFMTYLYQSENTVPVALSTDGGLTFSIVTKIVAPPKGTPTKAAGDGRGLFRFVDQPTITTGRRRGVGHVQRGRADVRNRSAGHRPRPGRSFSSGEVVPGTNNCTYGDISIGPAGQVMQVCTLTESGQGGGKLFVNVDPDGLGPAGFGDRVFVTATHVGGFDFIPPQPDRSVDAEPGLAWEDGAHRRPRLPRLHRRGEERERRHRHLRAPLGRRRRDMERPRARERRRHDEEPVHAEDLTRPDHREPRGDLVRLASRPRTRRSR